MRSKFIQLVEDYTDYITRREDIDNIDTTNPLVPYVGDDLRLDIKVPGEDSSHCYTVTAVSSDYKTLTIERNVKVFDVKKDKLGLPLDTTPVEDLTGKVKKIKIADLHDIACVGREVPNGKRVWEAHMFKTIQDLEDEKLPKDADASYQRPMAESDEIPANIVDDVRVIRSLVNEFNEFNADNKSITEYADIEKMQDLLDLTDKTDRDIVSEMKVAINKIAKKANLSEEKVFDLIKKI